MTLHLVLTYHWFDEILAGRKRCEYRALKRHWAKRIWKRRAEIESVVFSRGYTSTTLERQVVKIDIGPCPYTVGWDGQFYRIHFKQEGKICSRANSEKT